MPTTAAWRGGAPTADPAVVEKAFNGAEGSDGPPNMGDGPPHAMEGMVAEFVVE